MAKRGRPRKQDARRKPCGRLAVFFDEGHPFVLQHRADAVGERHKLSRFADSVIGRLYLVGAFGADDELAERRHNVLRDYADYHGRLYGTASAQSAMRDLTGMRGRSPEGDNDPLAGLYAKFKAWYAALMLLVPSPGCRLLTHHVTERAAVYDRPPTSPAELLTLIRAADRLLELRGWLESPGGARRKKHPPSERGRDRRRPDLLAIYNREIFGPDDDELAAALAQFRLLPPSGSAD